MIREFSDYLFTENRMDAKVILLFYELIAQIETGNELMVNDTLQNFNRYLLRNDLKSEFEQLMIRFLKIISSFSLKAKKELEVLREQLIQLPQKSILDQHRVLYQVLSTMIDSKLAGKKFHEYLKEMK
jgi:Txe/YoeB family toxin of Txe-Axe toxin-antitoxin module